MGQTTLTSFRQSKNCPSWKIKEFWILLENLDGQIDGSGWKVPISHLDSRLGHLTQSHVITFPCACARTRLCVCVCVYEKNEHHLLIGENPSYGNDMLKSQLLIRSFFFKGSDFTHMLVFLKICFLPPLSSFISSIWNWPDIASLTIVNSNHPQNCCWTAPTSYAPVPCITPIHLFSCLPSLMRLLVTYVACSLCHAVQGHEEVVWEAMEIEDGGSNDLWGQVTKLERWV